MVDCNGATVTLPLLTAQVVLANVDVQLIFTNTNATTATVVGQSSQFPSTSIPQGQSIIIRGIMLGGTCTWLKTFGPA